MKTDPVLSPVPYSFCFLLLALLLWLDCPTLHRLLTNFNLQQQTPQNHDPSREVVGSEVKVVVGQYHQRVQISSTFCVTNMSLVLVTLIWGKQKKKGKN